MKQIGWIDVYDRLPEPYSEVICYNSIGNWIQFGVLEGDKWFNRDQVRYQMKVTHWMPLPEPPKEEKGTAESA